MQKNTVNTTKKSKQVSFFFFLGGGYHIYIYIIDMANGWNYFEEELQEDIGLGNKGRGWKHVEKQLLRLGYTLQGG